MSCLNSTVWKNIIRIGSAGAYVGDLNLFDLVLADSAWSESTFPLAQAGVKSDVMEPSKELNERIIKAAKRLGKEVRLDRIHSSDIFYSEPACRRMKTSIVNMAVSVWKWKALRCSTMQRY